MSELAKAALILGGVLAVLYLPFVLAPSTTLRHLQRFHRHVWAGRLLAAVALGWSGWLLYETPLPWFAPFKPWLLLLVPVAVVLVAWLMQDMLAPRALGGVLLLAPAPLLSAAFLHPSPWRLVVVLLAYSMALKGMALVLSPYLFKKAVAHALPDQGSCRILGGVGLGLALTVFVMALTVY